MELEELYAQFQPLLFSIAYRMMGTVSDAEDIVHDVFLRASEKSIGLVENQKAYLCKMVTNQCIDHFKSAGNKREVYIGPWLPEPLLLDDHDPVTEILNGEAVSFAFLLLLEKLKPVERAVFILREVLDYDYITIAEIVDRSESHCRKILSRVKSRLPLNEELTQVPQHNEIIQTFVLALHQGDIQKIEELLHQDVTIYSDGGGNVYAALKPIYSKKLAGRFIAGLLAQNESSSAVVKVINVNGEIGLLVMGKDQVKTVFSFHVKNDRIEDIYIVRNPEKLKHVVL